MQLTKWSVSGLYFCTCSIYIKEIRCKHFWKGLLMKTWALIGITEGLLYSLHEVSFLRLRPAAPAEEPRTWLALVFASSQGLHREEKWAFETLGESLSNEETWEKSVTQPCPGRDAQDKFRVVFFFKCFSYQLLNFPPYQSKLPPFSHVWQVLFLFQWFL